MNADIIFNLEHIQQRFRELKLTDEQARRVYYHEEEKTMSESKLLFSPWEEADYDRYFFSSLLTREQFHLYEQQSKQKILQQEKDLTAQDVTKQNKIAYYLELVHYYKTTLVPALFKPPVFPFFGLLNFERAKIDYLKSAYKSFIQHTRKDLLVQHFRNYRLFMPNQLKISLLSHSLYFYLPDYSSFRSETDVPTKSMAQYFEDKVRRIDKKSWQTIKSIDDQLETFTNSIRSNYFGETGGWHVEIRINEDELMLNSLMSVLLIDKDHYEVDKYVI